MAGAKNRKIKATATLEFDCGRYLIKINSSRELFFNILKNENTFKYVRANTDYHMIGNHLDTSLSGVCRCHDGDRRHAIIDCLDYDVYETVE